MVLKIRNQGIFQPSVWVQPHLKSALITELTQNNFNTICDNQNTGANGQCN